MKKLNLVGIDISESSIKVLQLDNKNKIFAYGTAPLSVGVVEKGRINEVEAFATVLNDVLKKTKPNVLYSKDNAISAVFSLPESKLFTHFCIVPNTIERSQIENYVLTEARKIIPFAIDSLYWSIHILEEENSDLKATFISVQKTDLDNYIEAFSHTSVRPVLVVGELFSLGQALLPESLSNDGYIILDIGAHFTTIGIFGVDTVPNMSISVPQGGEHFTQFLAEKLSISFDEAEQLKKQFGVDSTHDNTKVPILLRECLMQITDKINEAKVYFETQTGSSIKHIILVGGSALLPQISAFISEKVGIETQIANPFSKIKRHRVFGGSTQGVFFANVIGLTLRSTSDDFSHINLFTKYKRDENNKMEFISVRNIHSFSDFYNLIAQIIQITKILILRRFKAIKKQIHKFMNLTKSLLQNSSSKTKLFSSVFLVLLSLVFLTWVVITYF